MDVLLAVWREAGRYTGIAESTARIAVILSEKLPVELVIVRRLDLAHRQLRTVAIGPDQPLDERLAPRTALSAAEFNEMLAACGQAQRARHEGDSTLDVTRCIAPPGLAGDRLIGTLRNEDGPLGFLILVAKSGVRFDPLHAELLEELLPPFVLALENDHRLHELQSDRHVAEADRQSLLRRLGRESLHDAIVGVDNGLRQVMERVVQVARADVPVLIFGETGSGKEVIARAIHDGSGRRDGPFLRVNCGAIPAELIDSELFGHERGSFTGAVGTRQGWFERADGGTLFLDEIGELPLAAQVRLLRVIQDGVFERVGGQRSLEVDVRIVGATHRDLPRMIAEHRFREDLWYRISVFPIYLPALRDRLEDLPALALHFAQRAARRFGLPLQVPNMADLDVMSRYPWPGNIRELAAVIDRAAILGNGQRLEIAQALGFGAIQRPQTDDARQELAVSSMPLAYAQRALPPRRISPMRAFSTDEPIIQPEHESAVIEPLDQAMRRYIEVALHHTRGRIDGPHGAARLLCINPHTLRARMRKLGIDWRRFRNDAQSA
jgi:transcriptional regulator with GAF, ATPase, and Fis domain